jgi:pimeloyl-ACP methyl ester carboxylesterase
MPMTMNAKRRRLHDRLAALPGVQAVRRPVYPGSSDEFDLYYVRTGRRSAHPMVILPGGPGAASVQLYKGLRRRAADAGLDLIMIEHRGVGMSRHDDSGADLPPQALTVNLVVDDVAAVLDDAHLDTAVICGASYGAYIAAGVGVRHAGCDDPRFANAVPARHGGGAERDPPAAVGRRSPGHRRIGTQGASPRRLRGMTPLRHHPRRVADEHDPRTGLTGAFSHCTLILGQVGKLADMLGVKPR